jgi:hypothetical protein
VPESSEANNANLHARTNIPVPEWGIHSNPGTKQGRGVRKIKFIGNSHYEIFLGNLVGAVAALSNFAIDWINSIIGAGAAILTVLLQALFAGCTRATGIYETADTNLIANLEVSDAIADPGNYPNNLMSGH